MKICHKLNNGFQAIQVTFYKILRDCYVISSDATVKIKKKT